MIGPTALLAVALAMAPQQPRDVRPRPPQGGTVVIDFEDVPTRGRGQGGPAVLTGRYAARGVTFNRVQVFDYAQGQQIPKFAHSGTHAIEQCYAAEFCTLPIAASFAAPQTRVKVWVGYSEPHPKPGTILFLAHDAAGTVIGRRAVSVPASKSAMPIATPMEIVDKDRRIAGVEIRAEGGLGASGLAVDDLEFESRTQAPPPQLDLVLGKPAFIAEPPAIVVPVLVTGMSSKATTIQASANGWASPVVVDVPPMEPGEHRLSIPLPAGLKPGPYFVALMINPSKALPESTFGNNAARLAVQIPEPPPRLDLVLGKPTFTAEPPAIVVPVLVRGGGSAATTIEATANGWPSPVVVNVPPMKPGPHSVSIPLPAGLKPGPYDVVLTINASKALKETTFENNSATLVVEIPQPPPRLDLALGKPTFTAEPPTIVVPVLVRGANADATTVQATANGWPSAVAVDVPPMKPGETSVSIPLPAGLKPGPYEVVLTINASKALQETTFENNSATLVVEIPLDLTLGDPAFTATPPSITVPVIVRGGSSDATTIQVTADGWTSPLIVAVPPMEAGEHPVTINLPADVRPGTYAVQLTIDPSNALKESNFENNSASVTVNIPEAPPANNTATVTVTTPEPTPAPPRGNPPPPPRPPPPLPWLLILGAALVVVAVALIIVRVSRGAPRGAVPLPNIAFKPFEATGTQTFQAGGHSPWGEFDVSLRAEGGSSSSSASKEAT